METLTTLERRALLLAGTGKLDARAIAEALGADAPAIRSALRAALIRLGTTAGAAGSPAHNETLSRA